MHTKNVRMRPVPLWGRCTGSTDFTSRKVTGQGGVVTTTSIASEPQDDSPIAEAH